MSLSKKSPGAVKESWGSTRFDANKFKFEWTIHNFGIFEINDKSNLITSPTFSVLENRENESEFYLLLDTCVSHSNSRDKYMSVYLHCNTKLTEAIHMKYKLTLKANTTILKEYISKSITMTKGSKDGVQQFVERNLVFKHDQTNSSVYSDDKLTIICEGKCIGDTIKCLTSLKPPQFEISEPQFSNHFGNLLKEEIYSDVTLCVPGKEFKVHKIILATQSPVFRAMFDHRTEKAQENRVNITDLDQEDISQMLHFMYTGKLQNLDKVSFGLLAAADKYAIEELKMLCGKELCSKLSVENAAEMFKIADLHSVKEMKTHIVYFMNKYMNSRFMTEEWVSMSQTHEHLIADVYEALRGYKEQDNTINR